MKPRKKVCGAGVNDADYVTQRFETIGCVNGKLKQKLVWACPYYRVWKDMLKRCYSEKYQQQQPAYAGCTVSKEWLTFSSFKTWMGDQNWEGNHLDKDLLFEGNKVYSADTCVFVSPMANTFTTDRGNSRGEWLIGAYQDKRTGKFQSKCSNPFTKKHEHLGLFATEQEAHEAWRKRKLELAHELSVIQTDPRVAKALINRYSKPYIAKTLPI